MTHVIDVEVAKEEEDDLAAEVEAEEEEAEADMTIAVLEEILQVQEPTTDWLSKICHLVLLGRI